MSNTSSTADMWHRFIETVGKNCLEADHRIPIFIHISKTFQLLKHLKINVAECSWWEPPHRSDKQTGRPRFPVKKNPKQLLESSKSMQSNSALSVLFELLN